MKPVTDPALLSQLDQRGPVTDAALLAQLEGQEVPAANQPAPIRKRDWADVPGNALSSVPKDAANIAGGVWNAVTHPIDTAGTVWDAAVGGARKILPEGMKGDFFTSSPEGIKKMSERHERQDVTANAVGEVFKPYGSEEGIKQKLSDEPLSVLLDLSTVLSGGAALTGKIPKAAALAEALKKGASYTNPINMAGKVLSPVVSGAKNKRLDIEQKVAIKAASDAAAETASARSAAGNAAQNAYKQLEHLRELDAMGLLTDEQRLLAASLSKELAQKAAEKLTPAAALKQSTSDAYKASIESEGARASKLAQEKLSGAEIKSQTMARLKRYGPAAVGGVIGNMLLPGAGGAVGGAATGLVLRPAIHSMRRLAQNPAVQHKMLSPVVGAGDLAEALSPYGIPAFQAGRIQTGHINSLVGNDESREKAEALAAILSAR